MTRKINDFFNTLGLYSIFLLTAILLVACGGNGGGDEVAGGGGGGGGTVDTTAPTVSETNPSDGSIMKTVDSITITFDETMDTSSQSLHGTIAAESDGGIWSTSQKPVGSSFHLKATNDTLTINPKTTWSSGEERTLIIDAIDLAGNPLPTVNLDFNIVHDIIYVSTATNGGNDGNPGTIDEPKETINAAIAQADAQKSALPTELEPTALYAVFVSEGNYAVDSLGGAGNQVILKDGISVLGGYSTDFSERDPGTHVTTISDTSNTGGLNFFNPNRAVETHGFIDTPTFLDGFTIKGSDQGSHSGAIYINGGGAPTIQNNIILGGGTDLQIPDPFSMGIVNLDGNPTIQDNTIFGGRGDRVSIGFLSGSSSFQTIQDNDIDGGNGGNFSYGIWSTLDSPGSTIQNNTLRGGSGSTESNGIYNDNSSSGIRNNLINGGNGNLSIGISNDSGASPIIQNNTIDGGSGLNESYGIRDTDSSPVTIENNIVFTSGSGTEYCLFEMDNGANVIRNNDLFECLGSLYAHSISNFFFGDINQVNGLAQASGNVSSDPVFADRGGGDFHLTSSSPSDVTQGGLDFSSEFTSDKDGNTRTDPWSIGAYEQD